MKIDTYILIIVSKYFMSSIVSGLNCIAIKIRFIQIRKRWILEQSNPLSYSYTSYKHLLNLAHTWPSLGKI
jgi:hypothetical protein